jgi:hypothetical protein
MKVITAEIVCIAFSLAGWTTAQTLPFPFGTTAGDLRTGLTNDGSSSFLFLPRVMTFLDRNNISLVTQANDGFIQLYRDFSPDLVQSGFVYAYSQDLDTRNGGTDQNELWLRVGNSTNDLHRAREIIAGTGTLFHPRAIIVATWYKVEAYSRRMNAQNTFQLAMPYSETGTTWVIFSYSQLQFYQSLSYPSSLIEYGALGSIGRRIYTVDSNEKMIALLNGTNCNRTGVYAFPINTAPTNAPTKAPTMAPAKAPVEAPAKAPVEAPAKAPAKAPTMTSPNAPMAVPVPVITPLPQTCGLFGGGVICPRTRCGWLGRWLGFCKTN